MDHTKATSRETHVMLKRTFENSNVRSKITDVRPKRSDVRLKRSNVRFNFVTFRLPYGRVRTGPASFKEQRSRTRRRSHCMPRRLRIEPQDSHVRGTE